MDAKAVAGKIMWALRSDRAVGLDSNTIVEGRYLVLRRGTRHKIVGFLRVSLAAEAADPKLDYSAALRGALHQQRLRGLFEGVHRAGLPFLYLLMVSEARKQKSGTQPLEFDLVVGTWIQGQAGKADELQDEVERRIGILNASLAVALPDSTITRLLDGELSRFAGNLLLPGSDALPQTGEATIVSSAVTFEERSPSVATPTRVPEFFVPGVADSGWDGILLGKVRSSSGDYHDFSLRAEDLQRHVAILGMTGSGKSTTGSSILRQASELGIPALVLDWHNEYRGVVERVGGRVAIPGADDFSVNPLDPGQLPPGPEHIAMVTDIFSDVYHFTHPQAYMFRNALQKRVSESGSTVPTLTSLVKTIEGYPLRSAYDNETKVALLRRLVPLTEGQAGKSLGGPGTVPMSELMRGAACVELGNLRDVQTRAMFTDIVLKMVYEYKMKDGRGKDHLTVVEEARNIAPMRRPEDPPSVGERMVSELRKFGESMIFVAQFPSQVASELVKNCGTKIVHRVAWREDISAISDSMNLGPSQREHLAELMVGEAVVSVARIHRPFLVQVQAPGQTGERSDLSFSADL